MMPPQMTGEAYRKSPATAANNWEGKVYWRQRPLLGQAEMIKILNRDDHGFVDISATALKAAISGSILAEPEACLVMMIALPFGSTLALATAKFGEYAGNGWRLESCSVPVDAEFFRLWPIASRATEPRSTPG